MPQIKRSRRAALQARTAPIKEKGDICFLITTDIIIPTWSSAPRWDTVSVLRRQLVQEPDMVRLKSLSRGGPFDEGEIRNQAALAFMEFYRRVAGNYEDVKAKANGDVYAGVFHSKSGAIMREG